MIDGKKMNPRSQIARQAMPVFYRDLNDLNVFIEDTAEGYDRIYQNILTRILADYKIKRVFPIGSRGIVLEKARQDITNKKSIFFVDGDLYLLGGEIEDIPTNVVVLERYCIENYLADKDSLNDITNDEIVNFTEASNDDILDYNTWCITARSNLKNLFILFSLCHTLGTGIKNVSHGYRAIISNPNGDIDTNKVKKLHDEIYSKLSESITLPYLDFKINEVKKNIDTTACFVNKYVSAKDFTLPIFLMRLRNITSSKCSALLLKTRLSRKLPIEHFNNLKKSVLQIISR